MRKIFFVLCGLMIFSSVCSARISPDRFFLGGLTVESPMSLAISMYGEPSRTEHKDRRNFHYYGDESFCLVELDRRIIAIYSTANNEIATPDGVTVGMSDEIITQIYGKADSVNQLEDATEYIFYKTNRVRNYEELKFSVREGKIISIILRYVL